MPLVRGIVFLLGGLLLGGCMQSDANFTARDRRELADPPYKQAWFTPLQYQRQVVQYDRKEPAGSILVDTEARYV